MRIHGFMMDSNKIIYAFAEVYGQKVKRIVCYQGDRDYIRTGSAMGHDLELHYFSKAQTSALNAFIDSPKTIEVYDNAI